MSKNKMYPYAVARVRMLERSLLTEKQYSQMVEAKSMQEVLKLLSEAGYGAGLTEQNVSAALAARQKKAYDDIAELAEGQSFLDVFLLKNDYHNLKVLLKEEVSGVDGSAYLIGGGTVDVEVMRQAFETKAFDVLPPFFVEDVQQAREVYAKTASGQMIDVVLDRAAFAAMAKKAKESRHPFVEGYLTRLANLTNLKSFFRVKAMKKPFELLRDVFVPGGDLDLAVFQAAFGNEDAIGAWKNSPYQALTEELRLGYTAFEKACDNVLIDYMKEAKYAALTLEPMVAYLYAVEAEVKTVRIILNGKTNGIEAAVIKERLRDAYV